MSIRADLRKYLISKTSVTALVDERVFPLQAKMGVAYPRIIYSEAGGERTRSLSGCNEQVQTSVSFECQAKGDNASDVTSSIADALANVLDCFQGTMNGTTVQGVFYRRDPDSLDMADDGSDEPIKVANCSIDLWYESTVPSYV